MVNFYLKNIPKKDFENLSDYAKKLSAKLGVRITKTQLIRKGIKIILQKGGYNE